MKHYSEPKYRFSSIHKKLKVVSGKFFVIFHSFRVILLEAYSSWLYGSIWGLSTPPGIYSLKGLSGPKSGWAPLENLQSPLVKFNPDLYILRLERNC